MLKLQKYSVITIIVWSSYGLLLGRRDRERGRWREKERGRDNIPREREKPEQPKPAHTLIVKYITQLHVCTHNTLPPTKDAHMYMYMYMYTNTHSHIEVVVAGLIGVNDKLLHCVIVSIKEDILQRA